MAHTNPAVATVNLPLNRLHSSPDNVRRTGGEEGMRELKASILAHGLLQNLNVRREVGPRGGPTGRYFVVAGGRRLAALQSLAEAGKIGRTARIPCRIGVTTRKCAECPARANGRATQAAGTLSAS